MNNFLLNAEIFLISKRHKHFIFISKLAEFKSIISSAETSKPMLW